MTFKKLSAFFGTGLLVVSVFSGSVFAQTPSPRAGAVVCNRLVDVIGKVDERIGQKEGTLATRRGDRLKDIANRRANRDKQLVDIRTKADLARAAQYKKLEEKVTTDAQKAAVKTFESTINAGIAIRWAAVDAAIKTYRDGVDSLLAVRKTQVDGAIATFKSSVDAAITRAKSDCASGVDGKTVKANLQASIKAARDKLKGDILAADKVKTQAEALTATRKTAIQKAMDDFKALAEKAKTDLKTAFGKNSSPTATP